MRKIEDVLTSFILTIFFLLNTYSFAYALFSEPLPLWTWIYRVGLSVATIAGIVGCFVDGRKNDENDPWSEIKKENGRNAYFLFIFGVLFIFAFAAAFTDREWLVGIVFLIIAVGLLIFGVSSIETMSEYIKVITPTELRKGIRKEIVDYVVVEQSMISIRKYGESFEVTVKNQSGESKIVLDDHTPDMTWFTTSGRTVKLYKVDQWVIVLFDCPRRVEVYESKVHPS